MHQPSWAHSALNIAAVGLSVYSIVFLVSLLLDRRWVLIDPVKAAKRRMDRRWTHLIFLVGFGQIVAVHYFKSFDRLHEVSNRTLIIACCGFLAPALGMLRMWLDKKLTKPKQIQQEQPYYTAGRTER